MSFFHWWLVGLSLAVGFHGWAMWGLRRERRIVARTLLEVHGMLVGLLERDPQARRILLQSALQHREDP